MAEQGIDRIEDIERRIERVDQSLMVEVGTDMDAFGRAERLASWVGICPGNIESAGKRKSGRIRKGNAWVRRLLCEFAQAACRTTSAHKILRKHGFIAEHAAA